MLMITELENILAIIDNKFQHLFQGKDRKLHDQCLTAFVHPQARSVHFSVLHEQHFR